MKIICISFLNLVTLISFEAFLLKEANAKPNTEEISCLSFYSDSDGPSETQVRRNEVGTYDFKFRENQNGKFRVLASELSCIFSEEPEYSFVTWCKNDEKGITLSLNQSREAGFYSAAEDMKVLSFDYVSARLRIFGEKSPMPSEFKTRIEGCKKL